MRSSGAHLLRECDGASSATSGSGGKFSPRGRCGTALLPLRLAEAGPVIRRAWAPAAHNWLAFPSSAGRGVFVARFSLSSLTFFRWVGVRTQLPNGAPRMTVQLAGARGIFPSGHHWTGSSGAPLGRVRGLDQLTVAA
eukprot:3559235-Pyramimonas_sp.AAC.1